MVELEMKVNVKELYTRLCPKCRAEMEKLVTFSPKKEEIRKILTGEGGE